MLYSYQGVIVRCSTSRVSPLEVNGGSIGVFLYYTTMSRASRLFLVRSLLSRVSRGDRGRRSNAPLGRGVSCVGRGVDEAKGVTLVCRMGYGRRGGRPGQINLCGVDRCGPAPLRPRKDVRYRDLVRRRVGQCGGGRRRRVLLGTSNSSYYYYREAGGASRPYRGV